MALTPEAFQPPHGPLRPSLFPGDDLAAFLTAWIAEASEKASGAGVATDGPEARSYVLWRAYDLRCQTAADPAATGAVKAVSADGEGRVEYDTSHTKAPDYCALAERYKFEAGAIIAPLPADPYDDWPRARSLR